MLVLSLYIVPSGLNLLWVVDWELVCLQTGSLARTVFLPKSFQRLTIQGQ